MLNVPTTVFINNRLVHISSVDNYGEHCTLYYANYDSDSRNVYLMSITSIPDGRYYNWSTLFNQDSGADFILLEAKDSVTIELPHALNCYYADNVDPTHFHVTPDQVFRGDVVVSENDGLPRKPRRRSQPILTNFDIDLSNLKRFYAEYRRAELSLKDFACELADERLIMRMSRDGQTLLQVLLLSDGPDHLDDYLLAQHLCRYNPEIASQCDLKGNSALHLVLKHNRRMTDMLEQMTLLMRYGLDVNQPNHAGVTPIHVIWQRIDEVNNAHVIIHYLLALGADVSDDFFRQPLNASANATDIITDLVSTVRSNAACSNSVMFDLADSFGNTMLHYCLMFAVAATRDFLLLHADVNAKNKRGHTPLATLFAENELGLCDDYLDTVTKLLSAGADVNVRDQNNRTALHWAVLQTSHETLLAIECLIHRVDNVNASDSNRQTALHLLSTTPFIDKRTHEAWRLSPVAIKVLKLLIARGAKFSMADKLLNTPLHITYISQLARYDAGEALSDTHGNSIITFIYEWSTLALATMTQDEFTVLSNRPNQMGKSIQHLRSACQDAIASILSSPRDPVRQTSSLSPAKRIKLTEYTTPNGTATSAGQRVHNVRVTTRRSLFASATPRPATVESDASTAQTTRAP